jgi:hypothetical protein
VLVDEYVGFDAWEMQGKNFEKLELLNMGQPQGQHWLINYKRTNFLKRKCYRRKESKTKCIG